MRTMTYTKKLIGVTLMCAALIFTSCEKEFDTPPVKDIPVGSVLMVEDVKALYIPGDERVIDTDMSVYGVVTMDESTGNVYKEAFIQDVTGGLYLRFKSSAGVYLGDSIRVNLNGAKILKYNNMFQVDDLDPDLNVVKQSTQNFRQPEVATISQIANLDTFYQGRLVLLKDVEFACNELGNTYADAVNQFSESRMLQDTLGSQVIVRTSGYANFAGDVLPTGKGDFIAIVTQYNNDMQLLIRNPNELTLSGTRKEKCPLLTKNFDDQSVTSGGWTTQLVTGPLNCDWGLYISSNSAAKVTNWDGSNNSACESWLISPAMNLSGTTNPVLNFRNTFRYTGAALELYVSTNYSGTGDPNLATWTNLTSMATWDTDSNNWVWTSSGNVSLASYLQSNVHIAFKYTGSASDGSTWEVDDITVIDN